MKFKDYISSIINGNYLFEELINLALVEDLDKNKISCLTTDVLNIDTSIIGNLFIKEPSVICGLEIIEYLFKLNYPASTCNFKYCDGQTVNSDKELIGIIMTSANNLLKTERLALNIIQHLSGIATQTRKIVELLNPFGIKLRDTRKTIPAMRILEKYATFIGGAENHRFNLNDKILIKDNHIKLCGGLNNVLSKFDNLTNVEIEIESIVQLIELLSIDTNHEIDTILLDNMNDKQIIECIKLCKNRYKIEVSGGITPNNIKEYLISGVDYISLGYLTHSVKSTDYSLKLDMVSKIII